MEQEEFNKLYRRFLERLERTEETIYRDCKMLTTLAQLSSEAESDKITYNRRQEKLSLIQKIEKSKAEHEVLVSVFAEVITDHADSGSTTKNMMTLPEAKVWIHSQLRGIPDSIKTCEHCGQITWE